MSAWLVSLQGKQILSTTSVSPLLPQLSHEHMLTLMPSFAIGIVGDAGVRGTAQQPRLFVGMILILIFAEVLGLYGLIVALLMNSKGTQDVACK